MREMSEFTIQDLVPIAITFVVTAIVIGYGASVVTSVQNSSGVSGDAMHNVTGFGLTALNTFGSNLPLLATIVVAAIIIGILIVYLGGSLMNR